MLERRDFLKLSAAGLGSLFFPLDLRAAANPEDPHFFLHIYSYGGIDSRFWFDGRPLSMVGAGLMHDYIKKEPTVWTGKNGTSTLVNDTALDLEPYRDRFSVINGILMSTAFDGHLQNTNFLFTGNPFGGESFVPHMNDRDRALYTPRPLDAIQSGSFVLDHTNGGNTIPMTAASAHRLIEAVKQMRPINLEHPVLKFISSRFLGLSHGPGRFSAACGAMALGHGNAPSLAEKLRKLVVKSPEVEPDNERNFVDLMAGCFREGICSSAVMSLSPSVYLLDTHSAGNAKHQPEIYRTLMAKLRKVFDFLATTPYDDHRSLLDVTTVFAGSEFGRALRQPGLPLDATGTDHNCLSNSMIVAGKGIRGGLVIGETDWRSANETLSGAHKLMDPAGLKLMGKPFDFATCRPRSDLPAGYDADDYLNISSVINTLYSVLSVPQSRWRTVKREGPKAPIISALRA